MELGEKQKDYPAQANINSNVENIRTGAKNQIALYENQAEQAWLAYLYMSNSDKSKYGTFLEGLSSQHALKNKQYPVVLEDAHQALTNHKWDPEHFKKKDRKKNNNNNNKSKDEDKVKQDEKPSELSFASIKNTCYCCGGTHKLNDCPERASKPKSLWHINTAKEAKQYQHMVSQIETVMNDKSPNVRIFV